METKTTWNKWSRQNYFVELFGVAKMADGYTLEDLAIIRGEYIDWEDLEYLDDDYEEYSYIMDMTKPDWA